MFWVRFGHILRQKHHNCIANREVFVRLCYLFCVYEKGTGY